MAECEPKDCEPKEGDPQDTDPMNNERRRSPRFHCGGQVKVYCRPFDGKSISGTLRNLSLGGVCLEIARPVEPGARAEVVVQMNAASFRAAALVKEQKEVGSTSLEFLQIGGVAKDVLADLLTQLAQMQWLNRRLRSPRMEADIKRMLMRRAVGVGGGKSKAVIAVASGGLMPSEVGGAAVIEPELEVEGFEIDLFG
jgi:hypothetical protein